MQKNTAGKWVVFAYGLPDHANDGQPITGDALNITADMRIDGAAANAIDDTNPTELGNGYYIFDITSAESNGDNLLIDPVSATGSVQVIGAPGTVWTRPPNFETLAITAGAIDNVTLCATTTTNTDMVGTDSAATAAELAKVPKSDGTTSWNATALAAVNAECDTAMTDYDAATGTEIAAVVTDLDDIKGTAFVKDTHSLVDIEAYVDILDDGTSGNAKIATDAATILVDTAAMQPIVAKIPLSDGVISWNSTALAAINAEADTALTDYDPSTNTEMVAAFTEIKGATWAAGTDTLEHIRNKQTDIETDTAEIGTAGLGLSNLGGSANNWNTVVPDAAGVAPTAVENRQEMDSNSTVLATIATDTTTDIPALIATAQTDLDTLTAGIIIGVTKAGTSGTTQVSTTLSAYSANQLIGRIITFTSGNAEGESSDITAYTVTNGVITFTAMTVDPVAGSSVTFKIT